MFIPHMNRVFSDQCTKVYMYSMVPKYWKSKKCKSFSPFEFFNIKMISVKLRFTFDNKRNKKQLHNSVKVAPSQHVRSNLHSSGAENGHVKDRRH